MPKLKHIKIRLLICWNIITNRYNHFYILNVSDEDLKNCLSNKPYDTDGYYVGLQVYVAEKIVRDLAVRKDPIEVALDKAQFEADAIEYQNSKK